MVTVTRALWTTGILVILWACGRFGPAIGDYYFRILILCGLSIILAVSLNIVNGFAGQFSLGHAGFMAVGAYTSAALTHYKGQAIVSSLTTLGVSDSAANTALLGLAIALGAACAALTGLCVSLPSFRLRGDIWPS